MNLLEYKKNNGNLGIIHFIGIGGIGMSGIATILHSLGYAVQGSDLSTNGNTQRLQKSGVKIFDHHCPENIQNATYVVISSAISLYNVELKAAITNAIPVIPRAQMLAEIMRFKTCVAVSGSHGKTTTTSMIAHLFETAAIYPTVINGGIINEKQTNAYAGSSDYLIAEADESDATFIKIPATIAIITNIDSEHLDFYGSLDNLNQAFATFVENIPFYGFAVCCIDDPLVEKIVNANTTKQIITYAIANKDANVTAFNIELAGFSSRFDVKISLKNSSTIIIEKIDLAIPGEHNILNFLATIAVAMELDFGSKVIQKSAKTFAGVKRRFSKVATFAQNVIIDDYAHHPREITATLKAGRTLANKMGAKLIAVCQPHRYSRAVSLLPEFASCFGEADQVYIAPIYSAGEENTTNISHATIVNRINNPKAQVINSLEEMTPIIRQLTGKNLIIMMGAGSITHYANSLQSLLND
jgi:UDP-N-acetylmuramate--alanine ligase